MDLLEYPSCKLYKNGRFRLPNKVRKHFEKLRVKQVVLLADSQNKIRIIPVSKWERMKLAEKDKLPVQYPIRAQALAGTFLVLHPVLKQYLSNTENLFFQFVKADEPNFNETDKPIWNETGYLIWNEADYETENMIKIEEMLRPF
ncbi:MAG: hypothetical protein K9M99_02560 [Candidatus Cloacimonetes bacterium]|nr:hypothetical protein [Candidatus Cloacimonadota bacterium]